ncbi:MAG: GTP-dependent dephospho-CoA kinase family protein [Halobacteriales archaeon]
MTSALVLPDEMRAELKEPMGDISPEVEEDRLTGRVVAVGDMVTYHLLGAGVTPDVAVVDGRTKREDVDDAVVERWKEMRVAARVENKPGTVSRALVDALRDAYDEGGLVEVDGEEDLAVLPAVALASDGDTVVYGQPNEGMVYVKADDEARDYVLDILDRMEGGDLLSGLRNS